MSKQAQRGGQVGQNGDFYKGGQFLPNTELPKRATITRKPTRKQEIEPFVWIAPEQDGQRSIYSAVAGSVANYNRTTKQLTINDSTNFFQQASSEQQQKWIDMVAAFNNGERWFTV